MWQFLASIFPSAPIVPAPAPAPPPPALVLHEWGTFTAVAGDDGWPVRWRPLAGPSDLPEFVYTPDELGDGQRVLPTPGGGKGMAGTVRMETPVIYLYAPGPTDVRVAVDFPGGTITEWYPRASEWTGSRIDWGTVRVLPGLDAPLPDDGSASHYYPAREVDAAPIQVCDLRGDEVERFLFYRGVGDFPLSLGARADERTIELLPSCNGGPGRALVFERQGDAVGFVVTDGVGTIPRPALDDELPDVLGAVRELLLAEGLYRKEADAMIETWRPDWFEEGLRVLYLLPRAEVDERLPLTVSPAPDEVVRVIVGRLEVPTPEQDSVVAGLVHDAKDDGAALASVTDRFGRFGEPLLRRSSDPRAARIVARLDAQPIVTVD